MVFVRHGKDGQAALWICRTLCVSLAWAQAARALPQRETDFGVTPLTEFTGLIPSAPPRSEAPSLGLIPSAPRPSGLIPSQPPQLIPSQSSQLIPSSPPPGLIPSQPPPGIIPSQVPQPSSAAPPPPPGLIPSGPIPSGPIPSQPGINPSQTAALPPLIPTLDPIASNAPITPMPSMISTDEGLRPIPAPTTILPGNPDGHHEISEPNFSITAPCRGCSPVVEISATGWDDAWHSSPVPEHQDAESSKPPKATITAGPSPVIVSPDPAGGGFVVDKTSTVKPGQTFTRDGTPIVIQTSSGRTEIVVGGSSTISLTANNPQYQDSSITDRPLAAPITIGGQTITPNPASEYVIASQTLQPGGPAITVDGSTISLLPSATAVVVNGVTSTLAQYFGSIYTTTALGLLTVNGKVYTANRAGRYILGPGTTLAAGGSAITVSGTVLSLAPEGTAVVIQGSTSALMPATTVVTLTRSGGPSEAMGNLPQNTGKHGAAATLVVGGGLGENAWLESLFVLMVMGFGWLAVWL